MFVFLELFQLTRRFPQFQNFLLELGDVTIGRLQFRSAGAESALKITRLEMQTEKGRLNRRNKLLGNRRSLDGLTEWHPRQGHSGRNHNRAQNRDH